MQNEDKFFVTELELKQLAEEYGCDIKDLCRVCGQLIRVQIFKHQGYCSDKHRKLLTGDDPSPYPFSGSPATGAT